MVKREGTLLNCHSFAAWYGALQQNRLRLPSMSALLGVITVVYGSSMLVAAGGSLLYAVSPRFRYLVKGDTPAF
jgi:hypothetical protein